MLILKSLHAPSMKILITSDNHLGFKETDPIRSEDSFTTFDEILSLAHRERVDFVLQGGDLFHENKPSRYTYNKTLQILEKYCLGEAKPTFRSNVPLNSDNPNINISLPIFSIHGNHDDPSGFNNISPLDILHSAGLVNYFGKVDNVDDIELQPILIERDRKVAIFGLGHIKDRRLYRTFHKGNVKYKRPVGKDWFNILMVHQNRVPRKQEYLPEDLIDPFFDLVIYGHEHESIKTRHRNFDVIQCGSSIRTSLCEGEKSDKYVYILEFLEKPCIKRIVLETVRPLIMESIKIGNGDPVVQVRHKIEEMLHNFRYHSCLLPLARLKVELEGSIGFNRNQIFPFLEENVANPSDSLKIVRRTEKRPLKLTGAIQKSEIEDIYNEILRNLDFKTLVQLKVMDSLRDFVEKDSKEAFTVMVKESVADIISNIDFEVVMTSGIEDAIKIARDALVRKDNGTEELDEISFVVSEDQSELFLKNGSAGTLKPKELCRMAPLSKEPHLEYTSTPTLCLEGVESHASTEKEGVDEEDNRQVRSASSTCNQSSKKQKAIDSSDDDLFGFARYF